MSAAARSSIMRRGICVGTTAVLALTAAASPAMADPVYPSQHRVDDAKAAEGLKARDIARAETKLAMAAARLETVQIEAAVAAEDFHEATATAEQAVVTAEQAEATAEGAAGQVVSARSAIGRMAASSYRAGVDLGGLEVYAGASGPQDVLDRAAALDSIGTQRQRSFQRVDATEVVAAMLTARAAAARVQAEQAATEAQQAKDAAASRAASAAAEVGRVEQTRAALIDELARLRETSVALEQERQAGIAAERQRQIEARARAEAERVAREQAAQQQADQAARQAQADRDRARQDAEYQTRQNAQRQVQQRASRDQPADRPTRVPPRPAPAPVAAPVAPVAPSGPSGSPSAGSSAGQGAVDWAMRQIGKPYLWGGTGPDRFDCSGLTSQAWANGGGSSIPRVSRDQYRGMGQVSLDALRPGDLVFFGTDPGSAASVYHVGMYIGGGQMVEAPYTGADVRLSSIYRSNLMPYGTRP